MKKIIAIILILLVPFLIGAQTTYLTGPGITYPQGLNTNGLVGYWKLGTNYKTDGTILGNYGSNPPNMTKSGTTVVNDPEYGPVRYFDGIDDYLYQEIIASGSNGYMTTIDDGVFFWDPNFNFSPYLSALSDKRYMLVATDLSGNKAGGYIGGTGSGETLGSELITNGDMEGGFTGGLADDWTKVGTNSTYTEETTIMHGGGSAQKITWISGDGDSGLSQSAILPGKLYKIVCWVQANVIRTFQSQMGGSMDIISVVVEADTWTELFGYTTSASSTFMCYVDFGHQAGDIYYFDDISIKQVTSPPANESVILYSTKTGSIQSLAWEESGFNPNDIASWEIRRTDFQIIGSFTLGVWIKTPNKDITQQIIRKDAGSGNRSFYLVEINNHIRVFMTGDGSAAVYRTGDIVVTDGNWHFIVTIFDAGNQTLKLFIDNIEDIGSLTGTVPSVVFDSHKNLTISEFGETWFGSIADVFIFSRALSPIEVKHLYDHPPANITMMQQ